MPFKSEKQRKWMWANDPEMAKKWEKEEKMKKETKVRQLIKKMVREMMKEDFAGSYPAHVRKQFDGKRRKQSEVLGYKLTGKDDVKTEIGDATIKETAKRDYKDEYKKFQSSTKSKKYRAELNKYNRDKGTYGNGDGKDASHKGGKIVGFEKESVNRGRAEKSRLKKEEKLTEAGVNVWYFYKKANKDKKKFFKMLSDFRKKHSDTKWIKMLNYALEDFNENPKKYKTIDDKQNILFKNLQNNKKVYEGKVTEAISGSDRKIMFMIVREILENLKKVSKSIKPSNTIGRGVLSILRAMTYTPDNANYKNYKKYFPKTFNSKLTQKRVAQFHKQTDKVQLTMVKQAMAKVLGEGKLTEGGAQIAKTILQQLGGNKFIAMTGAKNLAHTNKGLQMKIGRNAKGVTHVIIDLDKGKDLYDIEFVKVRGASRKTVKKLKGIYADQLGEVFTRYTGLNVRL